MARTVEASRSLNPFALADHPSVAAAKNLSVDPQRRAALSEPVRELHLSLPVRMDDGEIRHFKGIFIQYTDVRGPHRGGVICDPKQLSGPELERVSRAYLDAVDWIVGPDAAG